MTGYGGDHVQRCAYCGHVLDRRYYFCSRCATPYVSANNVLPPTRPGMLTGERLVALKAPHAKNLFLTYLVLLVITGVAGALLRGVIGTTGVLVMQTLALFITMCVFAMMHWPSLAVQFRRFGFANAWAWVSLGALVPMLAINYVYHSWVMRDIGMDMPEVWSDMPVRAQIFFICVMPAVLEEVAFRGLLQHWLQVALRAMPALVLSSALFMSLHFSVISAPYLFGVGMLLGWAKYKTGSLYPPILIHFLHNLAVTQILQ